MRETKFSATRNHALDDDGTDGDEILAQRARRGDERAFNLLFRRYHREVEAFVRSRVQGHAEVAEDITIDIFTKVFRFLDSYQSGSFRGWIYQIARNTVIDYSRGYRVDEPLDQIHDIVSSMPEPDTQVIVNEMRTELLAALATLPPIPRRILELRLKGYGLSEICDDLGMELSAVKSAQHRALRKLRVTLHGTVTDQGNRV